MAKVMIVDDSLFMRNHLSKLLSRKGYQTIMAENGDQAVRNYRHDHPDAVVMDITMPRKDGLQALTEIRELDSGARVIMLTAVDQELAVTRAIHLGAKDFLVKPVPPNRLLAALQQVLKNGSWNYSCFFPHSAKSYRISELPRVRSECSWEFFWLHIQ